MAGKLDLLLEAEKRGILDSKNQALLSEARSRGIITSGEQIPEPRTTEDIIESGKPRGQRAFLEEGPEALGGIVGGIGGALIGKTPGAIRAGAVAGAGVGGAIGKTASQALLGEEIDPQEIAISGGRQALFEAGVRAVVGIGQKILAPFAKSVTPEAQLAKETLDRFIPKGSPSILPAEATENRVLDIMENIAEASIVGGKKISDFKNIIRKKALDDMIDDLASSFGSQVEADVLGETIESVIKGNLKTARLPATSLYNNVTSRVEPLGDIISTKGLKAFAKPLAEKAKKLKGLGGANTGDDMVKGIMALPDNINYSTAQELRSRLISKADEFAVINKKAPAIGRAKKLAGLADSSIGTALKKHDKEALGIWRNANKIWKTTSDKFDNKFIRGLVKEAATKNNPEVIAEKIFKPRAVSNIRKIKTATDPETFQQLKRWHVDSLLKKSVNPDGELIGNNLFNNMFGKTGMGEQAMKEIYSPIELASLRKSANALKVIQSRQGEGAGRMLIQLTQAGAIAGLLDERSRPISLVILGGPAVLSRIMTNPTGAKWLIQGAKLPAKSPQVSAIIAKLSDLAIKIRGDIEKETGIKDTVDIQELTGVSTLGGS